MGWLMVFLGVQAQTIFQCQHKHHNLFCIKLSSVKAVILDPMDPIVKICLVSDIVLAYQLVDNEFTGQIAKTRQKYWVH
eukprot:1867889-Ditylum_brightwellii.AAC.2